MEVIHTIRSILYYPLRYIRMPFIFYVLFEVLWDLNGFLLEIILVKVIIDSIQMNTDFEQICIRILAFGVYFVIFQFAYCLYMAVVWEKAKHRFSYKMQSFLSRHSSRMDIEQYDDPAFYEDYTRSVLVYEQKIMDVISSITIALRMVIRVAAVIVFLSFVNAGVMALIAVSCLCTVFLNRYAGKYRYKQYTENVIHDKRLGYINRIFSGREYAKDLRAYTSFQRLWSREMGELTDKKKQVVRKYDKPLFLVYLIMEYVLGSFVLRGVVILFVAWQILVSQSLPYSAFAVIIPSILDLNDSMNNLANVIPLMIENNYYVKNILDYIGKRSRLREHPVTEKIPTEIREIRLFHVSFAYSDKKILKDVSLEIHPEEKIAIVGENGAGKTTLIKIILRLYDPQEGTVSYGGNNVTSYNPDEYYRVFGTIFQDFKLFPFTIRDNVLMDRFEGQDDSTVLSAAERSGFLEVMNAAGYSPDSFVTREFDGNGILLSGGEMQKLALSRIFTGESAVLILDEPSSALDPVSEAALNEILINRCPGKTVIFISHRLSTTRKADRIILLDDGRIAEEGTHKELMELNGKYAAMFTMQAENYRQRGA